MISEYLMEKWERKRGGMVRALWREAERKNEASEEQADTGVCWLPRAEALSGQATTKASSGSLVQLQLGSLLKSVAQVTTRAHIRDPRIWTTACKPCWSLGVMLQQGPYRSATQGYDVI